MEPFVRKIKERKFISLLADSWTDSSVRDLEGVYVTYVENGKAVNLFLAVEKLEHAHAQGHVDALDRGNFFKSMLPWQ